MEVFAWLLLFFALAFQWFGLPSGELGWRGGVAGSTLASHDAIIYGYLIVDFEQLFRTTTLSFTDIRLSTLASSSVQAAPPSCAPKRHPCVKCGTNIPRSHKSMVLTPYLESLGRRVFTQNSLSQPQFTSLFWKHLLCSSSRLHAFSIGGRLLSLTGIRDCVLGRASSRHLGALLSGSKA